jgi:hypothetical protein
MLAFVWRFALTFLAASAAFAAVKPDFSGTWKMDPARSESAHQDVPIGPVELVIHQTANALTLETRRSEKEVLEFKLDGAEAVNGSVTTKAHWNGTKLVLETVRDINGATITTMQTFQLVANGKEIIIDKTLTVQHGYQGLEAGTVTGKGRDVFTRAPTSPKP